MNIVLIHTGQYYSPEYAEFLFKTDCLKRELYDENFNLTNEFQTWLAKNHIEIYRSYITDRENFDIIYVQSDNVETISHINLIPE